MPSLDLVSEQIRAVFDERNRVRDEALVLSREIIRTCANTIRAGHRGEVERAREMLRGAREALAQLLAGLSGHPEILHTGYVYDCQKEFAEASAFLALIAGEDLPDPDSLGVDCAAYLNGLGETVGELRRHTLDTMRHGRLDEADRLLATMDEIYHHLVTMDYPDAITGGLRRTTDGVRGIIEKTRGELTTALRQDELRAALQEALAALASPAPEETSG
jgi:translin